MAEESKELALTIRVTPLVKAKAMRRVLQEGANSVTQHRRRTSFVTCAAVLVTLFVFDLAGRYAWSESLFDESVRVQMFKHSDGLELDLSGAHRVDRDKCNIPHPAPGRFEHFTCSVKNHEFDRDRQPASELAREIRRDAFWLSACRVGLCQHRVTEINRRAKLAARS